MNISWKNLILSLLIPFAVGGLATLLTSGGMASFSSINQPALAPPAWLFPVVWSILYLLMSIASYLIVSSGKEANIALTLYGVQLIIQFLWCIWFFHFGWYLFSFFWLILLWLFIAATILSFSQISKTAALLLLPYLIWVTFAGYLNFEIYRLNL